MNRARTALGLARVEALLLARNVLVLAGLLAAVVLAWGLLPHVQPLWWNADWQLGYYQLLLSATVLIAAQLATARARRDGLHELYASFPTGAGTRAAAHLVALTGAVPASLLLIVAITAMRFGDAVGSPSVAALVSGMLLVLAAGAIGVALGARIAHPLAGLLAAFVWVAPFSQSNRYSGPETWLFPWVAPDQLGALPAPVAGFPPAAWHAVWLAGITVLAGVVALAFTVRRRAHRIWTGLVGALAVAAICLAGVAQLQPIGAGTLDRLVRAIANPDTVQRCSLADGVRYCAYPHFGAQEAQWQPPIDAVLALLPHRPAETLTVRQSTVVTLNGSALGDGHSKRQLARWDAQLRTGPGSNAPDSTIYLAVGRWPDDATVSNARFTLALDTAEWAVGLPATGSATQPPCVAVDQAREAIAAWLAVTATHAATPDVDRRQISAAIVGDTAVPTWDYPGRHANYTLSANPVITAAGYQLAREMAGLPTARVTRVLEGAWPSWLDPHTTQARLAATLGLAVPQPPTLPPPPVGNRPPGNPVCGP